MLKIEKSQIGEETPSQLLLFAVVGKCREPSVSVDGTQEIFVNVVIEKSKIVAAVE